MSEPIIEVENLVKRYGKRTAVDNISFSIQEGAIFGFIGPNGAGKTTTIRIITTLLTPTTGQAFINGHSITQNPLAIRKLVGYMPDFFGVYTDMKVWEYLDFFSACYNIPPKERPILTDDLLSLVDLSHRRDDNVDGLSRGMKQRLCLARALVHDPKLLVLDEPASGLDPRARVEFRDLLVELRNMGKTIFLSSHILADLAEICTEVGIIEAGQMVTHGNIEEIKLRLQQGHMLHIQIVGDNVEQAKSVLVAIDGTQELEIEKNNDGGWKITLQFNGDKMAVSSLLKQLVIADVPVIAFTEEADSLEDMFMKLTKGIVS